MTYPWNAGDILTAADLNAEFGSKLDYPSGGSDGNVLTKSGTAAAWSAATPQGLTLITTATIAGSSSVSVDNCFSSTYQTYHFFLVGTTSSNQNLTLSFRASGSDDSSSNYARIFLTYAAGTGSSTGQSSMTIGASGSGTFLFQYMVAAPNISANTKVFGCANDSSNGGQFNSGGFIASTVFDGMTITTPSGTITGTLRIYGYRD
jgi:hypothetical protein